MGIAAGTAAATAMSSNNNHGARRGERLYNQRDHLRVRDCFGDRAGMRWRVRFDPALAERRTVPRRTDTRDLRCAVTAERFLHGAGERRRFQINRLRPDVAADLRRSANGIGRRDRSRSIKSAMSFTSAVVKDCIVRIFQSVTAFTNRLTPARPGRISDYAMVSRSRNWRSIQKMRIASLWP